MTDETKPDEARPGPHPGPRPRPWPHPYPQPYPDDMTCPQCGHLASMHMITGCTFPGCPCKLSY